MSLQAIQAELKAPKGQHNSFGNYRYRSCEDILEALKPVLAKHDMAVTLSDEIEVAGDRVYVKATARLLHKTGVVATTTAFAREAQSKKGMDDSQITGTASSYARKYALNGLFAIDDTKDADTDEVRHIANKVKTISKPSQDALIKLCAEAKMALPTFCEAFGIEDIKDLEVTKIEEAEERLKKRIKLLDEKDANS